MHQCEEPLRDIEQLSYEMERTFREIREIRAVVRSLESEVSAAKRREENLHKALSSPKPSLLIDYRMSYEGATDENVLIWDKEIIQEYVRTRNFAYLVRMVLPMVREDPGDIVNFGTVMVNNH